MNKSDLVIEIQSQFPGFSAVWEDEDIYRESNGEYTHHGLMSSFTDFFRENWDKAPESSLVNFASLLESIVSKDLQNTNLAANAVCTCFLENIAGEESGRFLQPFLGKSCRQFYKQWA